MRINRKILLKNARTAVIEKVHANRQLLCIYLTGSLLDDEPLLGGTADIDLIFVHNDEPPVPREVTPLTSDVHLDIAHYSQKVFNQLREMRSNPWLGAYLCENPIMMHDLQHWFEFTQASVCAHFERPDNVMLRARTLVESARQTWFNLSGGDYKTHPAWLMAYLKSLANAANAVAVLNGPPLTERRFLLNFNERAAAVERPGLSGGLEDLFYSPPSDTTDWEHDMKEWQAALSVAARQENPPARLAACRHKYYTAAADALHNDYPSAALWIMLRTWTLALLHQPQEQTSHDAWASACAQQRLDPEHLEQRLDELDAYLDSVEETVDAWAQEHGTETLAEID
jgi:hypothetical protein